MRCRVGRRRSRFVVATTRTAMELGRVICERDPVRARARDARLLAEQGGQVTTQYRQDMIPGLREGLIVPHSAGAGSILPQPMANVQGDIVRLDDLTGCTVRVVTTIDLPAVDRASLLAALQPLRGVLVLLGKPGDSTASVTHALEDVPVLAPWLAQLGQSFAVVRPDHCVFGTAGSAAEAASLLEALRAALAR